MSVPDIAAKYGVTTTRVQVWLSDDRAPATNGQKPLQLTAEHVHKYQTKQASAVDIAADVGRRASAVRYALVRAGVPARKRTPNTSIRLTAHDDAWVRQYNPALDVGDRSQCARLNTLIATGSRHLYKDDPDNVRATVMAARENFLAQLGISQRRAAQSARNLLLPSNIVINSRLLVGFGINLRRIAGDPGPLGSRSDVLQAMLDHLTGIGVDAKRACEGYPGILTMDPDVCADRLAHMQLLGIRPSAVMAHAPQLVVCTKQTFTERVEHLTNAGVDVVSVANIQPRVLLKNPAATAARLRQLAELGLDPPHVVTANPSIFGFSALTVTGKVGLIRSLGRMLGDPLLTEQCLHHTNLLQMSRARLVLLARLWSTYAHADPPEGAAPEADVRFIANAVRESVASYIVAVGTDPSVRPSLRRLHQDAKSARVRHGKVDRHALAYDMAASGRLGTIGTRYLRYIDCPR